MNNYTWEKFDHPKLAELRNLYNLSEIVGKSSEFEQQLILKDWVARVLPNGEPYEEYSDKSAIDTLRDAKENKKFWCTQHALTYLQCATALGWYSRKLAVDYKHTVNQEDRQHGITDIWSNKFKKWYVIDTQNNIHYEKEGKPLHALEIRLEYLKNHGRDIQGIVGNYSNNIGFKPDDIGFATPSNYFWFFISQRNNFFEKPGIYDSKAYLFIDEHNKDLVWYRNSKPHPMYEWAFIKTDNPEICFPVIN